MSGARHIVIVDSGGANIASVRHAFQRLGVTADLTRDRTRIARAAGVVLPGVGAARAAMRTLRDGGLDELIGRLTQPVLGICLGLQLLYEHSDEGDTPCLGIVPGTVGALPAIPGLRRPHMGWNRMVPAADDPLLQGLGERDWFYFVHGYAAPAAGALAVTTHGQPFAAMIRHNNFAACQFHPERSGAAGQRLLSNFIRQCT